MGAIVALEETEGFDCPQAYRMRLVSRKAEEIRALSEGGTWPPTDEEIDLGLTELRVGANEEAAVLEIAMRNESTGRSAGMWADRLKMEPERFSFGSRQRIERINMSEGNIQSLLMPGTSPGNPLQRIPMHATITAVRMPADGKEDPQGAGLVTELREAQPQAILDMVGSAYYGAADSELMKVKNGRTLLHFRIRTGSTERDLEAMAKGERRMATQPAPGELELCYVRVFQLSAQNADEVSWESVITLSAGATRADTITGLRRNLVGMVPSLYDSEAGYAAAKKGTVN